MTVKNVGSSKYLANLLVLVGALLVCFFIFAVVSTQLLSLWGINPTSREGILLASALQAVIVFIIPSFCVSRFISPVPLDFLKLNCFPGWLPFIGVVFGYVIALPALNQIIYWNSSITFPDSFASWGETLIDMENKANAAAESMMSVKSLGGLFTNLSIIALLTALAEELFFRGALQNSLALKRNRVLAVWFTAIIFSTMHFQIFGFVPRLLLGAWFGYLMFWSGSIYVPIFAHFINNGIVVLCSWFAARGSAIDFENLGVATSGFPLAAFVSFVAFVIFIVYFRKFFFFQSNNSNDVSGDCCRYQES